MQTISIPYSCDGAGKAFIAEARRLYSAAVRSAYANAEGMKEKDLRALVKTRFAGGLLDAWSLHCATLEGRDMHKRVPEGMVFGGKGNLERRRKGLISKDQWRELRLLPLCTRGDKTYGGNRHFKLSPDARTCTFTMLQGGRRKGEKMIWKSIVLDLPKMHGNAGTILRQAAQLAANKQINITFRLTEKHLHVTINPEDLPDHPERRRPVIAKPGRTIGVDLNPQWIGVAAINNIADATQLGDTTLLEHLLIEPDLPKTASLEMIRESLAVTCGRIIGLARKHGAGTIIVEKGLGKLRSRGKNRTLNRLINFWCRTVLLAMLRRKAKLSGIAVIEVWGGYSTTIGNLAFEAPDACASAAEIARRGLARARGDKELLPAMELAVCLGRWKDQGMPTAVRKALQSASSWGEVHRIIKTAKTFGVRRPHPSRDSETRSLPTGFAVHRLGWFYQPAEVFNIQAMG